MTVLQNKKLAINEDLISSVRVTTPDGGVVVGIGEDAVVIEPGEDADKIRKQYGLTSKDEDDKAAADKDAKDTKDGHAHAAQQPVKR